MSNICPEESSNTNFATEASQTRGSDSYDLMTDINEDGDLVVNFEVLVPSHHPILNSKIEDLEKSTNCRVEVKNH